MTIDATTTTTTITTTTTVEEIITIMIMYNNILTAQSNINNKILTALGFDPNTHACAMSVQHPAS
jgi:hypothetical protein